MLPDDMINEILINMNLKEFIRFSHTNKKHYKLCEHHWKRFYDQFDIDLKTKFPDLSYIRLVPIVYQIQKIIKTKHHNVLFKTDNYDKMLFLNYVADNKLKWHDGYGNKNYNFYIQNFTTGDFNNEWYISIYGKYKMYKYSHDVILQYKCNLDNMITFLADMFYHNIIVEYEL